MGIIDPMAIGSMAATGVLDFGSGPIVWFLTVGLLASAAVAVALSGLSLTRLRPKLLPLARVPLAVAAVSRAK